MVKRKRKVAKPKPLTVTIKRVVALSCHTGSKTARRLYHKYCRSKGIKYREDRPIRLSTIVKHAGLHRAIWILNHEVIKLPRSHRVWTISWFGRDNWIPSYVPYWADEKDYIKQVCRLLDGKKVHRPHRVEG